MMVWLNIGSLLLGLLAWTLPLVNLFRNRKNHVAFTMLSMGACAVSLSFQIFYHYHLVTIGDWSAIMDISGAVAFAAAVLLGGTILLNAITLIPHKKEVIS
ncbi:hypothetical protein [Rossellomorea yichunensis]|jgi:uncharacterized membrane protein YjjP (DUF1212 family)|uniref:hypothetical protein n=1 Tax=Rossellomorea yichunensis TaxID=3077331 RepID=UPI0028E3E030|nr:hypothetical protein [Rossellomorea sp. YC4-1]